MVKNVAIGLDKSSLPIPFLYYTLKTKLFLRIENSVCFFSFLKGIVLHFQVLSTLSYRYLEIFF